MRPQSRQKPLLNSHNRTSNEMWLKQLAAEERALLARAAEAEVAYEELRRRRRKAAHLRAAITELQAYLDEGGTFGTAPCAGCKQALEATKPQEDK